MAIAKKILLIEDDQNFLRMFYNQLVEEGYEVAVAGAADKAKTWATNANIEFDMIISDQRMPGERGADFLAFLSTLEGVSPEELEPGSPPYEQLKGKFPDVSADDFQSLIKRLKVHPHIRVILSGYVEDDSVKQALESSMIHKFISKSTSIAEVLEIIESLFAAENVSS